MTTADWALIISLGSLVVAAASFTWSVWSTFIYPKPKVDVGFNIMTVHNREGEDGPDGIALHATNHGPNPVRLVLAVARGRKRWPWSKASFGVLNPYRQFPPMHPQDTDGPFSGGLPKILEVGESFTVYFPVSLNWFENEHLTLFGWEDTFGRRHWCTRKAVKRVEERARVIVAAIQHAGAPGTDGT